MRLESIQNNDDDVNWDDDGDDDEDCVDDDDDDESQNNHQCHCPNSMLLFATTSIAQTRLPDKGRKIVHCFAEIRIAGSQKYTLFENLRNMVHCFAEI